MKLTILSILGTRLVSSHAIGPCCKNVEGELPPIDKITIVDDIQRIPCNSTSLESFQNLFEIPKQPVILVGCDEEWTAKSKWTFENIAQRFEPESIWRFVELESDLEVPEERIAWQHFIDSFDENRKFYVFDNLNTTHGKTLEDDYETPQFFKNDLYQHFKSFPPDYGPMRWFALGSRFTGTSVHYDPYETDAWNSVVHGMKWWMLFPPNAHKMIKDDYEMLGCDPSCSDENPSLVDYYKALWGSPDQVKDFFQGQQIRFVLQKEGETLYVPNGLIHSVMNMEDTIAITANYANANNNIAAIWDTLFDFDAENFEMERVYCRILNQRQRDELDYDYYCDHYTVESCRNPENKCYGQRA